MSRLLSGVENGRARIRRMGTLMIRIMAAWRRSRDGWSVIEFSVLMVLLVSLSSPSAIVVAGWSDKDGTSGYVEGGPADPRGVIRGQEQGGLGHVIGRPETLDRMAVAQLFLDCFGYLLLIALGQDRLGGEAVDSHTIGSRLGGQFLAEYLDARLCRRRRPAGTGESDGGRRPRTS